MTLSWNVSGQSKTWFLNCLTGSQMEMWRCSCMMQIHHSNGRWGHDLQFQRRLSHFPKALKHGNASIKIHLAKVKDNGTHICYFPRDDPERSTKPDVKVGECHSNRIIFSLLELSSVLATGEYLWRVKVALKSTWWPRLLVSDSGAHLEVSWVGLDHIAPAYRRSGEEAPSLTRLTLRHNRFKQGLGDCLSWLLAVWLSLSASCSSLAHKQPDVSRRSLWGRDAGVLCPDAYVAIYQCEHVVCLCGSFRWIEVGKDLETVVFHVHKCKWAQSPSRFVHPDLCRPATTQELDV